MKLKLLDKNIVRKNEREIKVIQFGEGNFLRGFVDYIFDIANENNLFDGDIVIVKPQEHGDLQFYKEQDCCYTVSLKGLVDGKEQVSNRIITSIKDVIHPYQEYEKYAELVKLESLQYVISNTTEAGIVFDSTDRLEYQPPKSFPGKLTKFLYERFLYFKGDIKKGFIILPTELIDKNARCLQDAVYKLSHLWKLEDSFLTWLSIACVFCNTLVDRIITGYPKEEELKLWNEYSYIDHLMVMGEPFALWVIEGDEQIADRMKLESTGLPILYTKNLSLYKQRKVRILNGAHTSFAMASFLAGNDTVRESMMDTEIRPYITKTVYDEIIPTLSLPEEELVSYARVVEERFLNPFIKHSLLSISLNSISKWKARCLPSFLDYNQKYNKLPKYLTFSLAALIQFYSGSEVKDGALIGHRDEKEYVIKDRNDVLQFFSAHEGDVSDLFITEFLSSEAFWDQDLSKIPHLCELLAENLKDIKTLGIINTLKKMNSLG